MADSETDKKEEVKVEEKSERQRDIEARRKNRVPPGVPSMNLAYPARDGYTRRVVCDREGRLQKFLRGGWTFVEKDQLPGGEEVNPGLLKATTREGVDSRVSQVVGSHKSGGPMTGYLMEIPTELYEEDQALKMESIDALEAGLRAGNDADGGGKVGEDGRYVPKHTGIKIEQKGRRR